MPTKPSTHIAKPTRSRVDQYNDPTYDYATYWQGREYEHLAEEIALRRLLKGKHFAVAADVGGGYGRLTVLLKDYADKVILAEPSQKQLDIAKQFLKNYPDIERRLMQADKLLFDDESIDLLVMVRVLHHLPDPSPEFSEIERVLAPNGRAVIEVANYTHALNRVKHSLKGQRMPLKPVDIRSPENRKASEIPFVNHNPRTVVRQLEHAGLRVDCVLSVSNLRNPKLKQWLPLSVMERLERWLQKPLAPLYFGPSIFFVVKKTNR